MNTEYYRISNNGELESYVVRGCLKIFMINIVLATIQITASERFALPFFSVMLNLWMLSIISGETKPEELMSITRIGFRSMKKIFGKKEEDTQSTPKRKTKKSKTK